MVPMLVAAAAYYDGGSVQWNNYLTSPGYIWSGQLDCMAAGPLEVTVT